MTAFKKHFWLWCIAFLFLATRLYKISQVPASVYWDEASIGYNAYAVATDLRDEWGEFSPLHFRAFGEFKLPVYIYSVAILTKLFGLNELAIRLPAVLFGLGAIILVYKNISKLAAFLLTVSPWLFVFTRTGYEAVAGLFFFLASIFTKNIFLSVIFGIGAFYSYNSFRLLIPIFLAVKFLQASKKNFLWFISLAIFLLSLIPVIKLYRFDQGAARLMAVRVNEPAALVKNYISHFSYDFLFREGDINERSQVPAWGQLYIIELPFLVAGLIYAIKNRKKHSWYLLAFLLLAPIPAAITRESPHALRAILMAPAIAGISAIAIGKLPKPFLVGAVSVYILFFAAYFSDFIKNYNTKTASSWQYEYKEIFAKQQEGEITDKYAQPYIFALYYLKYPPQKFRESVKYNSVDKWGFSTVASFGNFKFVHEE